MAAGHSILSAAEAFVPAHARCAFFHLHVLMSAWHTVVVVDRQGFKKTDSVKNLDNIELTPWVNIPLKTPLMLLSSL